MRPIKNIYRLIYRYVDAVHLMAYDYTSSNSNETGLLAPLTAIVIVLHTHEQILIYIVYRQLQLIIG